MRITRVEKGTVGGLDYRGTYTDVFTQPVHHFVAWWFYHHVWEKATWRIWRLLEKLPHKPDDWDNGYIHVPFTNRQDIRCFDLNRAGQKLIIDGYEPPLPVVVGWSCPHLKVTAIPGTIRRPPTSSMCDCGMTPIYADRVA